MLKLNCSVLDVQKLENSMRRQLFELLTLKFRAVFFFFFFLKATVWPPSTSIKIKLKTYRGAVDQYF